MKTLYLFITTIAVSIGFMACDDTWNDHYNSSGDLVNNDNVEAVDMSVAEFLSSEADYSEMYSLFQETGLLDQMNADEQLLTVLVVSNDNMSRSDEEETDSEKLYSAQTHVSDVSLSPSNVTDGQRVLMWCGKYIEVTKGLNQDTGDANSIAFNGSYVLRTIQAQNGYVYELSEKVTAPKSMYETIQELSDDYSIFRDMVLARCTQAFDQSSSLPIGYDQSGNVVYDTVWTTQCSYFSDEGMDILSESINGTMLIPSNTIIETALQEGKAKLAAWNLEREDTILENWFIQVAFFDTKLSISDLTTTDPDKIDLTSIFDRQWRTTVQQIDVTDSIPLSNGVAYYISDMRIPTNMLIYRLKDYFKYYENINDEEKAEYFTEDNLTFNSISTAVTEWSGWPEAGFPNITNVILTYDLTDGLDLSTAADTAAYSGTYRLDFVPFKYESTSAGHTTEAYLVPPGEYDLCLGFQQTSSNPHAIDIYFNDEYVGQVTASDLTKTTYHYDRGGQGYPEGYNSSLATNSKAGNYDRDGGKVGEVVIEGTEAQVVKISYVGVDVPIARPKTVFHHWCLKPTENCY